MDFEMTINFYLDNKSKQKEKLILCYIRGIEVGKTITYSTKERVKPINWNKEKQRVISTGKNKYIGAPEQNSFLSSYEESIKKTFRELRVENPTASYSEIKDLLDKKYKIGNDKTSFFDVYDLYVESKKNEWAKSSYSKFTYIKKLLLDFQRTTKTPVEFNKIDMLFYDKIMAYFYNEKKYLNNTVNRHFGLLKMFLNWATDRGLNTKTEYKKFKAKEDETEVIYLTRPEVMTLLNLDLADNEKLSNIRDVFCFSCFTGARFSDVSKIQHEDIKDNHWHFRTQKTKKLLIIPIVDEAQMILEKYKKYKKPLPVVSNQKTNKYLKELCEIAKIDEPISRTRFKGSQPIEVSKPKYSFITTHTARRTFTTLSLELGMRPETVMEITGHHDYKMMQKYIKISGKVKDAEMKKFWNNDTELKLVSNK
jgi:integrase